MGNSNKKQYILEDNVLSDMNDEFVFTITHVNHNIARGEMIKGDEKIYYTRIDLNLLNGKGKTIHNNCICEGMFKNGKLEGHGSMKKGKYKDEGEFKNGMLNGKGKSFRNGIIIEGEFKDGKLLGNGKVLHDGNTYIGNFKTNNLNGKGEIIYKNGDVYRGEFKNNKLNGYGKIINNCDTIEGEFKDNKLCGEGKVICKEGGYVNEGKFGKTEALVTSTFADGDIFKLKVKLAKNIISEGEIIKLENANFETWSASKVYTWSSTFSRYIGEHYKKTIMKNNINGKRLLFLRENDGDEFGIDSLSIRHIIYERDRLLGKDIKIIDDYEVINDSS